MIKLFISLVVVVFTLSVLESSATDNQKNVSEIDEQETLRGGNESLKILSIRLNGAETEKTVDYAK